MKTVHLEGMGLLGSMLAWHLYQEGIPFTWHDCDSKFRAWEASSGLIYPSGDKYDTENWEAWRRWAEFGKSPWPTHWPVTEASAFWFLSKTAPNGAKDPIVAEVGPLHLGARAAFHLNVPEFVLRTRNAFKATRSEKAMFDGDVQRVVAHGFNYKMTHTVWGWTADAKLKVDPRILEAFGDMRPTFYLRASRFRFQYANVRPGTDWWIAGSAHIVQQKPHELSMKDKLEKWKLYVENVTYGLVRVEEMTDPIAGWRPASTFAVGKRVRVGASGTVYLPCMEGNGVRHAPAVCREAMQILLAMRGVAP